MKTNYNCKSCKFLASLTLKSRSALIAFAVVASTAYCRADWTFVDSSYLKTNSDNNCVTEKWGTWATFSTNGTDVSAGEGGVSISGTIQGFVATTVWSGAGLDPSPLYVESYVDDYASADFNNEGPYFAYTGSMSDHFHIEGAVDVIGSAADYASNYAQIFVKGGQSNDGGTTGGMGGGGGDPWTPSDLLELTGYTTDSAADCYYSTSGDEESDGTPDISSAVGDYNGHMTFVVDLDDGLDFAYAAGLTVTVRLRGFANLTVSADSGTSRACARYKACGALSFGWN